MPKVLIIDETPLFKEYLKSRLENFGFEITIASNGLEGKVKMRSLLPNIVILNYPIPRIKIADFLRDIKSNPNTERIPLVMISSQFEKSVISELSRYDIQDFFVKPIKIDHFFKRLSELMSIELQFDMTPGIIETHFNSEILFIEISQGLNEEKIEILGFKIRELLEIYEVKNPNTLIIMTDMKLSEDDHAKAAQLFRTVLETTQSPAKGIKVLSRSEYLREFVIMVPEFQDIEVTDNLTHAVDGLYRFKTSTFVEEGQNIIKQDLLKVSKPKMEREESFQLKFAAEQPSKELSAGADTRKSLSVALVDDDIFIREWIKKVFEETGFAIRDFEDGKVFVEDPDVASFDLIILDLMMPEMNGFKVLQYLKENNVETPVIVLSALKKRETVTQAINFGIKSYLTKPLLPDALLKKTAAVLQTSF